MAKNSIRNHGQKNIFRFSFNFISRSFLFAPVNAAFKETNVIRFRQDYLIALILRDSANMYFELLFDILF